MFVCVFRGASRAVVVDAVMTAYLQVHSKRCVSDSCDGSTTLWRAWTGENALAASWLGGKKNARGNDSVWDGCHGSPNGVLVFWYLGDGGIGEWARGEMRMRLQSTNGCCHHFHTALSAHLTISRSHATALFVYSDSDYASAVIGQHLVHVDGVDDVKMHGTSPDPRASFSALC